MNIVEILNEKTISLSVLQYINLDSKVKLVITCSMKLELKGAAEAAVRLKASALRAKKGKGKENKKA